MRPASHCYQNQTMTLQENYRLVSLAIINTKILHKILANYIQQYIKNIHHEQAEFILECKVGITFENSVALIDYKENLMIFSINAGKHFIKFNTHS